MPVEYRNKILKHIGAEFGLVGHYLKSLSEQAMMGEQFQVWNPVQEDFWELIRGKKRGLEPEPAYLKGW